ncbi:brachyurin-like [Colias croceus]|uniref:brachyurin-like n=1 Tax=Colias crocea TaxID=72248 RepID=UPI001E281A99|nr:brachyurin-like [Colias croceus]
MQVLLFISVCISIAYAHEINPLAYTAYGYLKRFGIPEYERIHKAEDAIVNNNSSRITGGVPAAIGQYPYQVGLITEIIDTTDKAICGGSLISANRVLTAAHCWNDGEQQAWRFTVVLGSTYLFKDGTRIKSSAVQVHPLWVPYLIRNDIAVIFLPKALKFSDTISPIALPTKGDSEDYDGLSAIATGFGITFDRENVTENQSLQHVRLNIMTNFICSLAYPFLIRDSNICTNSFGGYSTCRGDSGGPLVIDTNNGRILIGITSFGSAIGCEFGLPAVFTRVSSYLDFISENTL